MDNKYYNREIKEKNVFKANEDKCERWDKVREKHPIRSNFQRDRDRILYSRAFRRLSGKTQVFTSTTDDHIRTRLTHTLEVSQIARTVSKELGLNEDLTEAIALGHDLGHTPFGHVGERTLNDIMNGCYTIEDFNISIDDNNKGFKHNFQSARVVTQLESKSLNLTKETIWGIIRHSSVESKSCKKDDFLNCKFKHKKNDERKTDDCSQELCYGFYDDIFQSLEDEKYWTLEGLVVAIADEIAQRHHDIEDAYDFEILDKEELCDQLSKTFNKSLEGERFKEQKKLLEKIRDEDDPYKTMDNFSKFIVDFLTTDLINNSKENLIKIKDEFKIETNEEFYKQKEGIFNYGNLLEDSKQGEFIFQIIQFSKEIKEGDKVLQNFLCNKILNSNKAQRMDGLGSYVIGKLFEAYTHNPQQLSDKTIESLYKNILSKEDTFREVQKDCKGDKTLINSILDKLRKINNVGDKRDFISYLHYNTIQEKTEESSQIEEIYKNALLRTICDYISGMTDKFALEDHKSLYNC